MKTYEFKCTECGETITTPYYLEGGAETWGHINNAVDRLGFAECGPLKRVWGAAIVWPMSERGH